MTSDKTISGILTRFALKKQKTFLLNVLKNDINMIEQQKKPEKKLNKILASKIKVKQSNSWWAGVSFILLVSFSQTNTRVTLLSSNGSLVFSQSSGGAGLEGKQKTNRKLSLKKLFFSLQDSLKKSIGYKTPIALHLKNVGGELKYITKIAEKLFFIRSIKSYDNVPFNGCRKKKIRRKKHARLTKR